MATEKRTRIALSLSDDDIARVTEAALQDGSQRPATWATQVVERELRRRMAGTRMAEVDQGGADILAALMRLRRHADGSAAAVVDLATLATVSSDVRAHLVALSAELHARLGQPDPPAASVPQERTGGAVKPRVPGPKGKVG